MGQEKAATHIIAKLIEMTMDGKEFTLNGGDFNTPDGTCVRDYVHVEDVANANFKLKPESPALKLGFKQIDMSKIGLKTAEFPKKYMKYNLQDVDGRKPNFHRNRAGQKIYDFW